MRTHIEINVQTGERSERPYTAEEEAAADAMAVQEERRELTAPEKLARTGLTVTDLRELLGMKA